MTRAKRFIQASRRAKAGMAGIAFAAAVFSAVAADEFPLRPYYDFVHWFSVGQLDRALDQFADNAVVEAGAACPRQRPCIGKAAIRGGLFPALTRGQLPLPLHDQRFDGRRLRTRSDPVVETAPDGNLVNLRGGYTFEFRAGRIAALRFDLDRSDPSTAAFIARREAASLLSRGP